MEEKNKKDPGLMVKVIEVIHLGVPRGDGSDNNPVRIVEQYWSLSGDLIVENDPID